MSDTQDLLVFAASVTLVMSIGCTFVSMMFLSMLLGMIIGRLLWLLFGPFVIGAKITLVLLRR